MNQPGQVSRSKAQSDALAIIGMLAIGALGVIVALVMLGNFLAGLPPLFAAAIATSLIIFAGACVYALMQRKEPVPRNPQPPVLTFNKKKGRMV